MLNKKSIEQVKVSWKYFGPKEAIWEMLDQMQALYPSLFANWGKEVLVWCWFMLAYVFLMFSYMYVYVCICIQM